jgi:hypothetical protein
MTCWDLTSAARIEAGCFHVLNKVDGGPPKHEIINFYRRRLCDGESGIRSEDSLTPKKRGELEIGLAQTHNGRQLDQEPGFLVLIDRAHISNVGSWDCNRGNHALPKSHEIEMVVREVLN